MECAKMHAIHGTKDTIKTHVPRVEEALAVDIKVEQFRKFIYAFSKRSETEWCDVVCTTHGQTNSQHNTQKIPGALVGKLQIHTLSPIYCGWADWMRLCVDTLSSSDASAV